MIDFVFPCHPKDFSSLRLTIEGVKKNISNYNNLFVISEEDPNIDGVIHFPEEKFSNLITKEEIRTIWEKKNKGLSNRAPWIYQQFLKLFSGSVIPNITESYVVVDSDTIFLKDVEFDDSKFYYCRAREYHIPYLNPIKKLLGIEETIGFSTICHHMIFNKKKLQDMISSIEKRFDKSFVESVLGVLDYNQLSGFSEWDLYANYMLLTSPEMCQQRQLSWADIRIIPNQEQMKELKTCFDFVSCHAYLRGVG